MNQTSSTAGKCPSCGSPALEDAVAGQCPRCLIGLALTADDEVPVAAENANAPRQFGNYVLGRQIGAGGMGVVYEARRVSDGGFCALKLIRDFHVASPTLLRRFTIEAEAVARLQHPNIVRIHEVGECEGHPYFSMDLIEGLNLSVAIEQKRAPGLSSSAQIALLTSKVARGIQHAHDCGVLHRDLKPANVLLDRHGEPHVSDFGVAKILHNQTGASDAPTLTTSAGALGTPSYMSPEQVSGGEATVASDVYGLGGILYALLTGRPPFQAATPLELFNQIAKQRPSPPHLLAPTVPTDLETICLKCLEKDPRHRYASAAALAEDLERFAGGNRIHGRNLGWLPRAQQWRQRNPLGAALIATLCVGLFIALALLKVVNDQRHEMELDRDQAFDDGMQKVSQIWRDPETRSVTISARELAILAGRPASDSRGAKSQFTVAVNADDGPSAMAQKYGRILGDLQLELSRLLGENTVFHLRLMKRFTDSEQALVRGEVDFLVLNAVGFLQAQANKPEVLAVSFTPPAHRGILFARTNSAIRELADFRGKSLALPDPGLPATIWAKARLAEAGVRAGDLHSVTNIPDQSTESGTATLSASETIELVLQGQWHGGVTHRSLFERYRHLGLVSIAETPETPSVFAARAGLDPRVIQALRTVLQSQHSSFRTAFKGGDELLETLRKTMQSAQRF